MILNNSVLLRYLTAGFNHLDVVEYLLENNADVNAKDKGGLVPLHNASSYGVSFNIVFSHIHLHVQVVVCFHFLIIMSL